MKDAYLMQIITKLQNSTLTSLKDFKTFKCKFLTYQA
ncbi:hypothetical protein SAMN04488541_1002116 [Thermoflexibacter ruber]|uniref:Uncharacterized protein n=1 Tax=Thermoflexibacter ruber TaxID=1003 RepID=A0A1I2B3A5_9BACT|nr:hypothetical protein SAMN04488541_1002116 [Thermoflexibacter ruber]